MGASKLQLLRKSDKSEDRKGLVTSGRAGSAGVLAPNYSDRDCVDGRLEAGHIASRTQETAQWDRIGAQTIETPNRLARPGVRNQIKVIRT